MDGFTCPYSRLTGKYQKTAPLSFDKGAVFWLKRDKKSKIEEEKVNNIIYRRW